MRATALQGTRCVYQVGGSTRNQELEAYLLGRTPALVNHEPIYDSAWRERCRLVTVPAGTVHMEITVMTRNAKQAGLDQRNI